LFGLSFGGIIQLLNIIFHFVICGSPHLPDLSKVDLELALMDASWEALAVILTVWVYHPAMQVKLGLMNVK